jgi:hypothetical protein
MRKIIFLVIVMVSGLVGVSAQTKEQTRGNSEPRQKEKAVSFWRVSHNPGSRPTGVLRLGPPTTYLKQGLRTEEVLRLLGQPGSISQRHDQGVIVTTYEFPRGEGRILIAEFVSDALVRSRVETRQQIAQVDRKV